MNMTHKLSLKDQILILNSKSSNYDVKYILSIIEIDLLIYLPAFVLSIH
jgi:hypothetical protein